MAYQISALLRDCFVRFTKHINFQNLWKNKDAKQQILNTIYQNYNISNKQQNTHSTL